MNNLYLLRKSLNQQVDQLDGFKELRESIDNVCDELEKKLMFQLNCCSNELCINCVNENKCESQIALDAKEMINHVDLDISVHVDKKQDLNHNDLNVHYSQHHSSIKKIKKLMICHWPDCGKKFSQSSHLKQHQSFILRITSLRVLFVAKSLSSEVI
jgi:hypothetical protein